MRMFIGGEWREGSEVTEVRNPWNDEVLDTVPNGTPEDVETALATAKEGAAVMRDMPAHERARILHRAAVLLAERQEEFGRTITLEEGKAIREGRGEAARAVETMTLSAEEAKRLYGETLPLDADPSGVGKVGFTLRMPVGVVVAITPFNYPLNLVCHKVGPALAAGNAVIVKPAEETPLSALKLVEVLLEAGVPAQAIQCLTGIGEDVGPPLVSDPRVRKVSFTGSRAVGEGITRIAGVKKLTLELGSNSPLIVMPDADLEQVAAAAATNAFANAGQVCISAQRSLVAASIYDDFLAALRTKTDEIVVGNPILEETVMGPMIRAADAERVNRWIQEAVGGGARVITGGGVSGNVHDATIVGDVLPEMRISNQELFGPAVAVSRFETIEDAVAMANRSEYGLAAGIFTRDVGTAMEFARRIEAGNVMINWGPQWRADLMPYGGVKGSGLGREGPRYAILDMTETKTIVFH